MVTIQSLRPPQYPTCEDGFSGKSTCHNSPLVPPIQHVYQNKFADQTLACFPIGPWALIGSQGLCWGDYGSKLSTLASLCVLQPWVQRFRGAPHLLRPRGAPSKDYITSRGGNRWIHLEVRAAAVWPNYRRGKICQLWKNKKRNICFLPHFIIWHFPHIFSVVLHH